MTRTLAALAAAGTMAAALTGCSPQLDPCRNVGIDEPALVQAARDYPEVEIEAAGENDAECILTRDGRWTAEHDDDEA